MLEDGRPPLPARLQRIPFTSYYPCGVAKRFNLDSVAYLRLDGVDTKPQAVARRIEKISGYEAVSMHEDSYNDDAIHYEITLGHTLYRRGLGGKRYSDGASVDGSIFVVIPRG